MKRRAFTLLELLVSMAIIAIIAALVTAAVGRARRSGATVREISAGRQMVGAYITASTDRGGEFMVGYSSKEQAVDDQEQPVINPACGRYPWRLAPYLTYKLKGVMLVNEQEHIATLPDHADYVYRASAYPSFGINATYVGGNERSGLIPSPATLRYYGNFVATRLNQVTQPGKLIVFASARYTGDSDNPGHKEHGFHLLTPPRTNKIEWQGSFDEDGPAEKFGFLDLRHGGRAVCVMLGGNVELLDEKQLQDMRYWSLQAADADDPDYQVRPIQ
jgi:prepilin-type N-terminal cleavage/methylation domain-containing protein